MAIIFGFTAKNCNGTQSMYFNIDNNELGLTLVGEYKDSNIQIDFESLTKQDTSDLIGLLQGFHSRMKDE